MLNAIRRVGLRNIQALQPWRATRPAAGGIRWCEAFHEPRCGWRRAIVQPPRWPRGSSASPCTRTRRCSPRRSRARSGGRRAIPPGSECTSCRRPGIRATLGRPPWARAFERRDEHRAQRLRTHRRQRRAAVHVGDVQHRLAAVRHGADYTAAQRAGRGLAPRDFSVLIDGLPRPFDLPSTLLALQPRPLRRRGRLCRSAAARALRGSLEQREQPGPRGVAVLRLRAVLA